MKTLIALMVIIFSTNAYGDTMIDEMITWEKVGVININRTRYSPPTIKLILKNPNVGDVVFAIVEINQYSIPNYILINQDIHKFRFDEPEYTEVELTQEAKNKIWIFLIGLGIANI